MIFVAVTAFATIPFGLLLAPGRLWHKTLIVERGQMIFRPPSSEQHLHQRGLSGSSNTGRFQETSPVAGGEWHLPIGVGIVAPAARSKALDPKLMVKDVNCLMFAICHYIGAQADDLPS